MNEFTYQDGNPIYDNDSDFYFETSHFDSILSELPDGYKWEYDDHDGYRYITLRVFLKNDDCLDFDHTRNDVTLCGESGEIMSFGSYKDKPSTIRDFVLGVEKMIDFLTL